MLQFNQPVLSQDWQTSVRQYFERLNDSQATSARGSLYQTSATLEMLDYVSVFFEDSVSRIRTEACRLLYRLSNQSDDPQIRQHGVELLARLCGQWDKELAGQAIRHLTRYRREDFNAHTMARIGAVVSGQTTHVTEIIKLAAFLQLKHLIPQIRPYTKPGHPGPLRWAALVSLSRLKDEESSSEMLRRIKAVPVSDELVYSYFPDLVFSRNPDAIAYMVEVLQSDDKNCLSANADKEVAIPCGYRIMEQLAPVVQNFPLKQDPTGDLIVDDYPAALQQVRQWFLLNETYKTMDDIY